MKQLSLRRHRRLRRCRRYMRRRRPFPVSTASKEKNERLLKLSFWR